MSTAAPSQQICRRLFDAYRQRDDEQFAEALRDVANMAAALKSVPKIAEAAEEHWQEDRDSKVGKLLIAMGRGLPGYRPDTDALHAAIARIEGMAR